MTETKRFPLRDVLTVTTDRLLTASQGERDNGIGALYEILGWMTNDSPFTHQLRRFSEECKPWLLRWFPELSPVLASLDSLDHWIASAPTCPDEGVRMWLAELREMFPDIKEAYDIPRIPQDDHDHIHPYDELVRNRGTDEGIVLVNQPSQPEPGE